MSYQIEWLVLRQNSNNSTLVYPKHATHARPDGFMPTVCYYDLREVRQTSRIGHC